MIVKPLQIPRLPIALSDFIKKARRNLEQCPPVWALAAGSALGIAIGAIALFGIGGWAGLLGCLLVLGVAVPLGINAQPVMVRRRVQLLEPELPPEPPPEPPPKSTLRIVEDIPGLLEMVELPGGTFLMGAPEYDDQASDDEKPQHEVTVSDFAMARFPVTRGLYREILGKDHTRWKGDKNDDQLPANYMSWYDAVDFCNALSEKQSLRPYYRRIGREQVEWQRDAEGYRLPTEAEWEYAVRAGKATRWFFGDDPTELDRYAWFNKNSGNEVHPVGKKSPNPWHFHDLIGNIWEWCWDWHGDYSSASECNPVGPDNGDYRVLRGGSYLSSARNLRSAYRYGLPPGLRDDLYGFRWVRAPRRQP